MVMMEEPADEVKTWGKTTARIQGVATRKELQIGVAERRLASGEFTGGLPRGGGKSCRKEEALAGRSVSFIGGGERGGGGVVLAFIGGAMAKLI
jgi:hypothetical protein